MLTPDEILWRFAFALDDAKECAKALSTALSAGAFPPRWTKASHEIFVRFCRANGIALPGDGAISGRTPGGFQEGSAKDPGGVPEGSRIIPGTDPTGMRAAS